MRLADGAAKVFSTLFHPLFIPTLGMFILFQLNTYINFSVSHEARRFIILIVFINTAIAPVLSVLILKRTGYVRDFLLDDRGERIFPLLIAAVLFFMTYYLLRQIPLPSLIYFYAMGATLVVLLTLLISFLWKISIHMVSLGGFTAFLILASVVLGVNIPWLIIAVFLVSGFTGASRLQLGAHSPAQVYAGYMLGFSVMFLLYFYVGS